MGDIPDSPCISFTDNIPSGRLKTTADNNLFQDPEVTQAQAQGHLPHLTLLMDWTRQHISPTCRCADEKNELLIQHSNDLTAHI